MAIRTHSLSLPAFLRRLASSLAPRTSLIAVWTIIAALLIQQSAFARIALRQPSSNRRGSDSVLAEAGSVFIDSKLGTKIVRVTDTRDGQALLPVRVNSSSFNLDSTRFFVNIDGIPNLFTFNPSSLEIQKQGSLVSSISLQFDSCHWSAAEADTIIGLGRLELSNSARLYAYDTRSGSYTVLKDFTDIFPASEALHLSKSWSDDNHFAFTVREPGGAPRFGVVWERTSDNIYLFDVADSIAGVTGFTEAHLDRAGNALIVNGDVTRVWRYRTQQQPEAVQLEKAGDSSSVKPESQEDPETDLFALVSGFSSVPRGDVSPDGRFSIFPARTDGSRSDVYIAAVSTAVSASGLTWTHMANCTAAANSLQKTAGVDQLDDAHATSTQAVLSGDAYVEFTAVQVDKERWCGLNNSNAIHQSAGDINFAIKLGNNQKANVVEDGVVKLKIKYKPNNVFRIALESGAVNYYKNGSVFYTSTAKPAYPLLVNASLVDSMATVSDAMIYISAVGTVVSISPARASVAAGATSQFTALVTGSNDTITWSATGGSVTSTGTFSAPGAAGTYTVKAACTSNPSTSAAATVSVTSSVADTVPPVITAISASSVTTSGVTISWNTDEPSDTQVEYGATVAYGVTSTRNPSMVTGHSVAFGGLTSNTLYHFRVRSADAAGNLAASGDFSFTTASAADTTPPVVSGVSASNVTATSATITWTTNEASDTQVDYGTTSSYGSSTTLAVSMVTSHSATLSNLVANTLQHFRVKSKDVASNLTSSGDFTFTTATIAPPPGGGTGTVKTDYGVYPEPAPPALPAAGGTFVDPTFGTTIMRLTDANDGVFNVNSYSYWPSINKDSTRLWVITNAGAMLYSFDSVNFRVSNKRLLFSRLPNGHTPDDNDATWSGTDADAIICHDGLKLYSYNVVGQVYTLVKDFGSNLPAGDLWQMSMSIDDNTFGFTVKNANGAVTGYIAFQRSQNSLYNVNAPDIDEVQVDKTGQWLVVKTGHSGAGVVRVQVINLATRVVQNLVDGAPDYAPGHSDVGSGLVIGGDNWRNTLTYRNLATSHTMFSVLDFPDWGIGAHLSMLADDESWIVMSTFLANDFPSTGVFRNELVQIATDGSKRIRRIAHLHSVYRDYWDQPRANVSRDGKFAVFTSNWGATDRRDVFIVRIPAAGSGGTGPGSLAISSPASSSVSASGAVITWTTNLASDTQVEYGTTGSYGLSTSVNAALVTSHSVTLSVLAASTTYHYRVKSNASGSLAVSSDMSFTTTAGGGGGGSARQNVTWTNTVNCTVSGSNLQKTSGRSDGSYDAGGLSQQSIVSGDGYLEFTVGETTTTRFCGLARNGSLTDYSLIDFGFKLTDTGIAEVRENFIYQAETTYVSGDVFRIAIEGGVVKYYKNGVRLFTSGRAPSYPLKADATFTHLGSTINNAAIAATSGGALALNFGSGGVLVAGVDSNVNVTASIGDSVAGITPSKVITSLPTLQASLRGPVDSDGSRRLLAGTVAFGDGSQKAVQRLDIS
jgi:hypothetical protein